MAGFPLSREGEKMKYINYQELNPKGNYPLMKDSLAKNKYPNQEAIVRFLRKGEVVLAQLSRNKDVFDGSVIESEVLTLTDGEYFWCNQLAHYVDKYNLRLPEEFEKHILKQ